MMSPESDAGPTARPPEWSASTAPTSPESEAAAETIAARSRRYVGNLRRVWRELSHRLPTGLGGRDLSDDPASLEQRLRARMQECLDARGGEVSARARAADLGRIYLELDEAGRARFIRVLARDFSVDRAALRGLAAAYAQAHDPADSRALETALREALAAPRIRLLTQFNALPQGVKFLIDLRATVLALLEDEPELAGLDADLKQLLASWFDIGFLDLKPITWDSPAALLEKLIAYEAVHRIRSWDDLHNRLDADRRCYAFFHPRMPSEPLIFVQVALVRGMASSIQPLLDENAPAGDPRTADCAVFYSISNAQEGLRGIAFGGFLIKQVVDALARDLPALAQFATLSPIPGFRSWLSGLEPERIRHIVGTRLDDQLRAAARPAHSAQDADWRDALERDGWPEDRALEGALRGPLLTLCAYYLLLARRGARPLDAVARFHLGNGAVIERLNWLGDVSAKGLRDSAGIMVNYGYRLREIEENHERYVGAGAIAAADAVRGLLPRWIESGRADARAD